MRPQLRRKGVRVGLEGQAHAIGANDLELVFYILIKAGKEYLPNARAHALAHHMPSAIPVVEVADDRNALRIGRPHGKMHPRGALMGNDMGPHLVIEPQMRALRHVVIVKRPQHRSKGVGIDDMPVAPGIGGLKAQGLALLQLDRAFKKTGVMGFREIADLLPGQGVGGQRVGPADKGPGHKAPPDFVQAENREGIMVLANDKCVNFSLA